ncbi:MAG: MBL fold metallo-hydrolase [Dehalococcoidia bacterium]|nr:MAG: MBL fold metallo-hydrolase [Dehalococcoidia bacterium]
MMKEVEADIFCIELPLPKSPLKSINCYLLRGNKRSLIIDTGMNRPECKDVLMPALAELKVDLAKTDIFVTHLHADHFGLVGDLQTGTSACYLGNLDAVIMKNHRHWDEFFRFFTENGFPEAILKESLSKHPGVLYASNRVPEITEVRDGQKLEIGDFELTCIETPGHSPGHMCLYEANKKILFSGDHILFDITPNISSWPEMDDSLRSYLSSLDKVADLQVASVLPGHRSHWHDHRARIKELKEHHRNRLDEALSALKNGDLTAYEVAPYITWKIEFKEWKDFPIAQQFFAVGEALAHLHYLENGAKIKSYKKDNGHVCFALA